MSLKIRKQSAFQKEDVCAIGGLESNKAELIQGETYSSQQEVQSYRVDFRSYV